MKRHLALLLAAMMLATVTFGRAQSIAYAIPVHGPTVVVAPQPLGTLRALPFLGDVDVAVLPGFTPVNGAPALGLALYRRVPAGPDVELQLGIHAVVVQGVPASAGLYLGFGWALR